MRFVPRFKNDEDGPLLSVIVPVRNSASTIAACVESILGQSMTDLELIVVGEVDDSSWPTLEHLDDPRLIRLGVQIERFGTVRDANLKRSIGLERARGRSIAVTDSDMTLPPDWASKGLNLLIAYDVVGGGMVSETSDFVGGYVDRNMLGSKTPRVAGDYILDNENFGKNGFKPPITASLFMRRSVYAAVGGPDPHFTNSYEDYEWARRMVDAGHRILVTNRVSGLHRHRTQWSKLLTEYTRSGAGASDYIVKFDHCHLSQARRRHLLVTGVGWLLLVLGCALAPHVTLALGVIGALGLAALSVHRVRRLEAAAYPALTAILGFHFWRGLADGLVEGPRATPVAQRLEEIASAQAA